MEDTFPRSLSAITILTFCKDGMTMSVEPQYESWTCLVFCLDEQLVNAAILSRKLIRMRTQAPLQILYFLIVKPFRNFRSTFHFLFFSFLFMNLFLVSGARCTDLLW